MSWTKPWKVRWRKTKFFRDRGEPQHWSAVGFLYESDARKSFDKRVMLHPYGTRIELLFQGRVVESYASGVRTKS